MAVIRTLLAAGLRRARVAGIPARRIVVDPGIGFFRAESVAWPEWDLRVLAGLSTLRALGRPLAVGVSRKSFLGAVLDRPGDRRPPRRLAGRHCHRGRARGRADPHARRGRDPRRRPVAQRLRAGPVMNDLIAAFRWRDALDILLVAILIYRVLTLFRGTRAVQISIGLAVLAGAAVLARTLGLTSLVWMLDHFWSFWVVAVIVVFQPELRRALAWIGQGPVLQRLLGGSAERARWWTSSSGPATRWPAGASAP